MMIIDCPHCGPRDEIEFRCGGQSHIQRPGLDASDATWAAYLHMRDNPKGWHFERWQHISGCRQWFNLARHTVSHEIAAVYAMTDSKPEILVEEQIK
jgi:sarcosine oxidase subunit delta